MKATWFVLVLAASGGCRATRLGQDPVIRRAFAAQAQRQSAAPAAGDASDAAGTMARHRDPMAGTQNAPAQGGAQLITLPAPQLGTP